MAVVAIIPARFGSTRLPGKVLLAETGRPLIQHVYESVRSSRRIDRLAVATDSPQVAQAVRAFGGEVVLTGSACRTGTDRLAEAAEKMRLPDGDIVVNVQGDEPDMPGQCVDKVVQMLENSDAQIATLATPITPQEADRLSLTKVVIGRDGRALYFSRARIPHDRDGEGRCTYYLHHGIYAYRASFLKVYAALPSTPAEQAEKLEQLRALEHGYRIIVGVVGYRGARIDTPEEYAAFVTRMKAGGGTGQSPAPAGNPPGERNVR